MFCVDTTVHRPVSIDVLCRHDRWMVVSTQNINTYWTMDGHVYTKHQYLLDDGWLCLHKTSIPTGRWTVVSTQNINTYWTMDGRVYTKHQYLLDDGWPCLHKTSISTGRLMFCVDTTVHRPVGIDVLCRHDRPSSSRY
jgi:hypothetical protein